MYTSLKERAKKDCRATEFRPNKSGTLHQVNSTVADHATAIEMSDSGVS